MSEAITPAPQTDPQAAVGQAIQALGAQLIMDNMAEEEAQGAEFDRILKESQQRILKGLNGG
jgi:hypothetical protein